MTTKRTTPVPHLDLKTLYTLVHGTPWHFDRHVDTSPAFASDADALACYRAIRPVLLPWCLEQFGVAPWAESLYEGRPTRQTGAKVPGATYDMLSQFLSHYAQQTGTGR